MAHGAGSAFLLPPCVTGSRAIALQRDQPGCCWRSWIVIQGSSRRPCEANGLSISQPDAATMADWRLLPSLPWSHAGRRSAVQGYGLLLGVSATTHMGMGRSRQSVSDGHDDNLHGQCGSRILSGSNSHAVAALIGCTMIPLAAGRGSGGRDPSVPRLFKPCSCPVRPPGSAGASQIPGRLEDLL
jgi:hypothetical protein